MPTLSLSLDQAENLELVYRKGEGRPFTITVKDGAGVAINTASLDFLFEVVDVHDKDTVLFSLVVGSGDGFITNGGVTGILTIDPDNDDVDLEEGSYEFRFIELSEPFTWLNAPFKINNSPRPSDLRSTANITINNGASNINLTIEGGIIQGGGSGTEHYRGEVSISTDLFPEDGGANDMRSGRPTRGDWFITTNAGNLLDRSEAVVEVPAGSMLYYTGDDDGDMQLGANWKINQG